MPTRSFSGVHRQVEILDYGVDKLQAALEYVFGKDYSDDFLYFGSRAEQGVVIATGGAVGPISEIVELQAATQLDAVAQEALRYIGDLPWRDRERMVSSTPTNTDDDPSADGWRLQLSTRFKGGVVVYIRPAWWS